MEQHKRVNENLVMRNVQITYRNFAGIASKYNRLGDRNFAAIIPDRETAERLANDGWRVKAREARNEGDEPMFYLPIAVNLQSFNPPKICMGSRKDNMIVVTEETIGELDHADIVKCDIQVRPYNWTTATDSGVKAYLKRMDVYIEEDPFANDNFEEEEFPVEEAEEDLPF